MGQQPAPFATWRSQNKPTSRDSAKPMGQQTRQSNVSHPAMEPDHVTKSKSRFETDRKIPSENERKPSDFAPYGMAVSLKELIHRQNLRMADLHASRQAGDTSLFFANVKQVEDKLDELNGRLERRTAELRQEAECMIGDIQHLGSAWVLPHPESTSPQIAPMVTDPEIERFVIRVAIAHEEAEGRVVESVEADNRGFDLISRKPHPEDAKTAIDVRFIEVKGRAYIGDIAVTGNEYKTAQRLGNDYWLYIVSDCARPEHRIDFLRNPATLDWEPIVKVEHYLLRIDSHRHLPQ